MSVLCAAAGVAALLAAPGAPSPPLDVATIAERHLNALGGADALRGMSALRLTGTLTSADGSVRRYLSERKRPNRCRSVSQAADGRTRISGYNGRVAWMLPEQGPVSVLSGRKAQDRIDACDFDEVPLLDHARRGIAVLYGGLVPLGGATCHKLDVTLASGARSTLYIDPSTWLVVRTDYAESDGTTIVQRVLARRVFGGVSFPTTVVMADAKGEYPLRVNIERIEIGVVIPDGRFDPPTVP
jgi:hypothetical protein